jgi:hypothetical protein
MADCCASLGAIARQCGGGNAARINSKIYVACVDDITTIPARDTDTHVISTDITMEATKVFFEWNLAKTENGYRAEPEGDTEFVTINHTLTGLVPKLSPAITYIFNGLIGGEFVVIFQDKNDQQRILGNLSDACIIRVVESAEDRNAYEVTIEWQDNEYALYYTGAIAT